MHKLATLKMKISTTASFYCDLHFVVSGECAERRGSREACNEHAVRLELVRIEHFRRRGSAKGHLHAKGQRWRGAKGQLLLRRDIAKGHYDAKGHSCEGT